MTNLIPHLWLTLPGVDGCTERYMAACYGSCPMGEKRKLHNAGSPQARGEVGSSCCRWRVIRSGIWGLLSPNVKIVALRLLGDVNPMTAASSG
ncbi:hypothetical protein P167DRAFT_540048 [Morchella conica CCBAS932]|uniref:Uncharacterized protein n=1 Tax=Morchella conica CCBAS932 TaxID=1392247 RepID=A0A3N4KGR2_9PEZI|nr:hypothetical protein P167DRAFT_540048 [Morchella conica CCBAS932]